MQKIQSGVDLQTVITTFEVAPAACQDLLDVLQEACNDFVSKQPGFIGAAIHVNDARTRIANYAQWQSREQFQEMLRSEGMQVYAKQFTTLSKGFQPVLYDVVTATL